MVIVLLFSSVVFTAVELEKWVKRILFKAQPEAVLVK
jgi:hypothetical protein